MGDDLDVFESSTDRFARRFVENNGLGNRTAFKDFRAFHRQAFLSILPVMVEAMVVAALEDSEGNVGDTDRAIDTAIEFTANIARRAYEILEFGKEVTGEPVADE